MPKELPKFRIIQTEEQEYHHMGATNKPAGCNYCVMNSKGTGFCQDFFPPDAKILFVFSAPFADDINDNRPLSGNMGWFRKSKLIFDLGLREQDVAVTNIIRCFPGLDKFRKLKYPNAEERKSCEVLCRQYDNRSFLAGQTVPHGVINYNPDLFVCTFDLEFLRMGSAYLHLIREDIRKAIRARERGASPAILFGEPAISLFAPYVTAPGQGGVKSWRGHIFEASWKDLAVDDEKVMEIAKTSNPFKRVVPPKEKSNVPFLGFAEGSKPAFNPFEKEK